MPSMQLSIVALTKTLENLKRAAPKLETLTVFPGIMPEDVEQDQKFNRPFSSNINDFHVHLIDFSYLSTLTTNASLLTLKGILALAELPSLKSLEISPTLFHPLIHSIQTVDIPPKSFPALRHLSLRLLSIPDVCTIWDMRHMIKLLTRLRLHLWVSEDDVPGSEAAELYMRTVIPLICQNSRRISHLTIDWGGPKQLTIVDDRMLEALSDYLATLPLGYLSIRHLTGVEFDANAVQSIPTSWSNLLHLVIPQYAIDMEKLGQLAKLPNLSRCSVSLGREVDWKFPPAESISLGSEHFQAFELCAENYSLPGGDVLRNLAE